MGLDQPHTNNPNPTWLHDDNKTKKFMKKATKKYKEKDNSVDEEIKSPKINKVMLGEDDDENYDLMDDVYKKPPKAHFMKEDFKSRKQQ